MLCASKVTFTLTWKILGIQTKGFHRIFVFIEIRLIGSSVTLINFWDSSCKGTVVIPSYARRKRLIEEENGPLIFRKVTIVIPFRSTFNHLQPSTLLRLRIWSTIPRKIMDEVKERATVDPPEAMDKEKETKIAEPSSPGDEFELTAEMMVNDFDDERTLDEEEALEEAEEQQSELSNLEKEKDMPIEDLLAMYGYTEIEEPSNPSPSPPPVPVPKEPVTITAAQHSVPSATRNALNNNSDENAETVLVVEKDDVRVKEEEDVIQAQDLATGDNDNVVTESEEDKCGVPPPDVKPDEVPMDIDLEAVSKEEAEPIADSTPSFENQEEELGDDEALKEPPSMLHELYKDDPMTGNSVVGARHLRSGSRQQSEEDEEEDEDVDYSPNPDGVEEDWKKTIMVGADYQAVIPEEGFQKYDDAMPYENEDKLLWDPHNLTDQQITDFIVATEAAQAAPEGVHRIPKGSHVRDDEQALYLFLQCGLNPDEAIRRQTMNSMPSMTSSSLWSEEECRNFESGLRQYGKDFHTIQQNRVRTRTVSELVQFYYLWKKTERHDLFAVKARLEKKKYILHPGTTDFMERFLDEQDSPATSPNVHSLLSGDPKRYKTSVPSQAMNNNSSPLDQINSRVASTNHCAEGEHIPEQEDEAKSSDDNPIIPSTVTSSTNNKPGPGTSANTTNEVDSVPVAKAST